MTSYRSIALLLVLLFTMLSFENLYAQLENGGSLNDGSSELNSESRAFTEMEDFDAIDENPNLANEEQPVVIDAIYDTHKSNLFTMPTFIIKFWQSRVVDMLIGFVLGSILCYAVMAFRKEKGM